MNSVVFITVDCLRADHVGCYGYERDTTPNIDGLAEEDDAEIVAGYANSPGTQWAVQSLYSGKWSAQIDGLGNPGGVTSLPETFRRHGYATAGFGINGHFTRHYGYDEGFDEFRGITDFRQDEGPLTRFGKYLNGALDHQRVQQFLSRVYNHYFLPAKSSVTDDAVGPTDEDLTDAVVDWISEQERTGQPYFTWVHLMDAHTPYPEREEHKEAVGTPPDEGHIFNPNKSGDLDDPAYRERAFRAYDSAIRSADEQIGRILDTVSDETVVVVTADHGEDFGEWVDFHYPSAYSSMAQIPLVIKDPGLPDAIPGPVSHIDLPPTLVAAAGIEQPAAWEGTPVQSGETRSDDPVYFVVPDVDYGLGIRLEDWKLVRVPDGETPLLYRNEHLEQEGGEIGEDHPDVREELDERLQEHLDRLRTANLKGAEKGWDTEEGRENLPDDVEENLEELGYL